MSRSTKKGPYVEASLYKKVEALNEKRIKRKLKILMKTFFLNLKNNKKMRLTVIVIAVAIVFFVCAGIVVTQGADINRLKKQQAAYSQQLEQQQADNDELQGIVESDNKDAYIEKKAREKGYVKSDEEVFYDVSGK